MRVGIGTLDKIQKYTGEFHCSVGFEAMHTVLSIPPGLSLPPTTIMSPPSRLTAAAWYFGLGRLPLAIISHDLVLGKYLWTAEEGLLLLSLPPMARRCPSSSAAAEEKSGLLQCSHMGDDVEASLLDSE